MTLQQRLHRCNAPRAALALALTLALAACGDDPTGTDGLTAPRARVAAGARHTCALDEDGRAVCWGDNRYGELGNPGVATDTSRLVGVAGGRQFASIVVNAPNSAVGPYVSCGLTDSGDAWCWGSNLSGALGPADATPCPGIALGTTPGETPCNREPTRVATGLASLSVGRDFLCGVTTDGEGLCWGNGARGQLGTGERSSSPTPRPVAGGHRWSHIAAGETHACGLTTAGEAWCWGVASFGGTGSTSGDSSAAPMRVATDLRFRVVDVGNAFSCGLTEAGQAYCWGSDASGQLGDGPEPGDQLGVVAVEAAVPFTALDLGLAHACATDASGVAYCWGNNQLGQLGDGTRVASPLPRPVADLPGAVGAVSAGLLHTCAATGPESWWCWGENSLGPGQLGTGVEGGVRTTPGRVIP